MRPMEAAESCLSKTSEVNFLVLAKPRNSILGSLFEPQDPKRWMTHLQGGSWKSIFRRRATMVDSLVGPLACFGPRVQYILSSNLILT